jgi:phospholipase/lecithinase/hemolysin
VLLGCLVLLATPARSEAQAPIDRIVVFGTSLSDSGNAFALRGGTNTPPDYSVSPFLIPDRPYARGGHHFSDGPTWVEQLAQSLGLGASVRPAFRSANPVASNYAVGGATAYEQGTGVDFSAQVQTFLEQFGGVAPSDALYVIEMGSGDVRDALFAISANGNGDVILQAALASIAANINLLYMAGARDFLLLNVPNLALTPAVRIAEVGTPGTMQLAAQVTLVFNAALQTVLGQLVVLPGIEIARLDVDQLLNDVVVSPASFGLSNVTNACITPGVPSFVCRHPDDFLFWDGGHPTAAAHAIIATEALQVLSQ